MYKIATPPWTPGRKVINTSMQWQSPLEQEQFEKMMADPVHRQYFIDRGWDKPDAITYKINSQGFRCDEFDDSPCLVALGCSYTFGVGLPIEDTWPMLVGRALGLKVFNLSWPGQGSDYCFRMANYWIGQLNTQYCVLLNPPISRVEVLMENGEAETFMPHSLSSHYNPNDWFLTQWMMNEDNHWLNNRRNALAIKQICAELDVPCNTYEAIEHMSGSREELEYARDYMHAGPKGHRIFAERILNEKART